MSARRLRINASKAQVLWLGSRHNIDRLTVHEVPVLSSTVGVVGSARYLGVVIDSRLSMTDHVASVCRSAYYHLRQIRPTLQSLSGDAAKTLDQTFISSRLDYCNLVLYGVSDHLLQRLQSVQNLFCRNCTGCLSDAVSTSNWQHWCSSHYTAAHRLISQTRASQSPSPLVWRHNMRHTMVQNSSGGQVVRCRRTTAVEQAACFTAVIWQSLPIQKTVENVFVCEGLGCSA